MTRRHSPRVAALLAAADRGDPGAGQAVDDLAEALADERRNGPVGDQDADAAADREARWSA